MTTMGAGAILLSQGNGSAKIGIFSGNKGATYSAANMYLPCSGTLHNLYTDVANPGMGRLLCSIVKNNIKTGLCTSYSASQGLKTELSTSVSVAAGDTICFEIENFSSVNATLRSFSLQFDE